MPNTRAALLTGAFLFFCAPALAKNAVVPSDTSPEIAAPEAAATAIPTATPAPKRVVKMTPNFKQVIEIHKPMPDPAWGKVLQYHREPAPAGKGTLHEFLFQDDQGTIRTAIYHEETSGEGYWEVLVWDLP